MDLEEIGINADNWVDSAQDRDYWSPLVNAALNLRFPKAMELVNILHHVNATKTILFRKRLNERN